ncbi:MAG: hypothetical protein IKJ98_06315, partial [Bacteroidales bacterium]|nr:hypothetical protein [Bacteroidales bacterium]
MPVFFLFCSVAGKGQGNDPVKPLSPKDSAFAAKEIELRQQYGEVVRHETVFEIKDNQVKYYRYYR